MKRVEYSNDFELSTGKRVYAYGGTMCPTDDGTLVYGSDGVVEENAEVRQREPDFIVLTEDERAEIAQYFILRWAQWGAQTDGKGRL